VVHDAPAVSPVALVLDEGAGVLAHVASHVLSTFAFRRQGLVPGNDVLSIVVYAEYLLNEKDLDSATRELTSVEGEREGSISGLARGCAAAAGGAASSGGTPLIHFR